MVNAPSIRAHSQPSIPQGAFFVEEKGFGVTDSKSSSEIKRIIVTQRTLLH